MMSEENGAACVYRYFNRRNDLLYVGVSHNPFARESKRHTHPEMTEVAYIEIEWFDEGGIEVLTIILLWAPPALGLFIAACILRDVMRSNRIAREADEALTELARLGQEYDAAN